MVNCVWGNGDFFALGIAPDDLLVAYGFVAGYIESEDMRASLLWIELKIQSASRTAVERAIRHIEPFSLSDELEGEFLPSGLTERHATRKSSRDHRSV